MAKLKIGDRAPDFQAPDQDEKPIGLSDFQGRKRFVYFYPKANTSG